MKVPFRPPAQADPQGDPATQAMDSLRGYTYQLYASGLAWTSLREDEELYLEVAQDYATAVRNAMQAVQFKDSAASITINSPNVRKALDHFVDLVERNADRRVSLRFLTTSRIGREQKSALRIGREPTLS